MENKSYEVENIKSTMSKKEHIELSIKEIGDIKISINYLNVSGFMEIEYFYSGIKRKLTGHFLTYKKDFKGYISKISDVQLFTRMGIKSTQFNAKESILNINRLIEEKVSENPSSLESAILALDELKKIPQDCDYKHFRHKFVRSKFLVSFIYPEKDYDYERLKGCVFSIPDSQEYFMKTIWPILKKEVFKLI